MKAGQPVIRLDRTLAEMDLQRKLVQLEMLRSAKSQPQPPGSAAPSPAALAAAETEVALARTRLELHTIRSPIDGVVDRIACKLGQTLAMNVGSSLAVGLPVGEVVDVRELEAVVSLPTFEASRVHVGQTATVVACHVPHGQKNGKSPAVSGKVVFVGQVVDSQTGNLPVRIFIDNAAGRFAVGATVAASITVREKAQALVVLAAAVDDLGRGPRLRVVRQGLSFLLRPRLGLKNKTWVEVEGTNLAPGEPVIVEGGYNLPDGTPVVGQSKPPKELAAGEEEDEEGGGDS